MDRLPTLSIDQKKLRTLVSQAILKLGRGDLITVTRQVAGLAVVHNHAELPIDSQNWSRFSGTVVHHRPGGGNFALSDDDCARVYDVMWDLVVDGFVRPGLGDGSSFAFPQFHITELGRNALAAK